MAKDLFSFRFIRERKRDAGAALTEINRKAVSAAYRIMRDVVLPRLKREAPGTVAKEHLFVQKLDQSSRSVKYGITVEKPYRYLFYTLPPGTKPHDIYPVKRKFLAFKWEGAPQGMRRLPDGRVLAKHVSHPGYAGDPWVSRAMSGIDIRQAFVTAYRQEGGSELEASAVGLSVTQYG